MERRSFVKVDDRPALGLPGLFHQLMKETHVPVT
jgi:hypothetical protein